MCSAGTRSGSPVCPVACGPWVIRLRSMRSRAEPGTRPTSADGSAETEPLVPLVPFGWRPKSHPRSRRYASSSAAPVSIARPRADSRPCQSHSAASSGFSPPAARTWAISGAICSSR